MDNNTGTKIRVCQNCTQAWNLEGKKILSAQQVISAAGSYRITTFPASKCPECSLVGETNETSKATESEVVQVQ